MSNIIEPVVTKDITTTPYFGNLKDQIFFENKFDYQQVLKLNSNQDFVLTGKDGVQLVSVAKGDPIEVIQYKYQVVPASGQNFVYVLKSHKDKQFDTLNTGKGILIEENYIVPADIKGNSWGDMFSDMIYIAPPFDMGSTTTKKIKVRLLEDVRSPGCTLGKIQFNLDSIFDNAKLFLSKSAVINATGYANTSSNSIGITSAVSHCVQYKKGQIVDCIWSPTTYGNGILKPSVIVTINDGTNTQLTSSQYVEVNENTPAYTDTPIKIRLLHDVYGAGCYQESKKFSELEIARTELNTKLPSCFFYKKGDVLNAVQRNNGMVGSTFPVIIQLNNGKNLGLVGGSHDYELQPHQYEIVVDIKQKVTTYPENLDKNNKLLNIALISVGALVALNVLTKNK